MEMAADTSFAEFFKDWYYGEGYPIFFVNEYTDPANNQRQMIKVSQAASHPSVSFFKMHIPIRVWKGANYHDIRLYHTAQDQEFVISEEKVDSIQFDPQRWLCAKADIVSGVPEVLNPAPVQIIHEPSTKRIRVILHEISENGVLNMYDLNGRTVLTGLLTDKDSSIEISALKNGMYVVEVRIKNAKRQEKIVISN